MTTAETFLLALLAIFTLPLAFAGRTYDPCPWSSCKSSALPEVYTTSIFRPDVIALVNAIATWAVMLFVFVAVLGIGMACAVAALPVLVLFPGQL